MGLDWEEGVFRLLMKIGRRFRRQAEDPPQRIHLTEDERRLTLLAQMISGQALRLRPAEDLGGVSGDELLMPARMDVHPTREANRRVLLLRALLGGVVVREGIDELPLADGWDRAEAILVAELPGAAALLAQAQADQAALGPCSPCWYRGDLRLRTGVIGGGKAGGLPESISGTEIEAPVREAVSVVELDREDAEKSVLKAPFEQVETVDSWKGGSRDADATDDLADHAEALDACDLREVIRGGETPKSLYRCDLLLDAQVGDSADEQAADGIPYDEWDHRRRAYRRAWCQVRSSRWAEVSPVWAQDADARLHSTIVRARTLAASARERLREQPRQVDGEEVDLEAWARELADRRSGAGGEQRLYRRLARRRREWATTILIDVSLSSDAGVGGRRVLDVSRDAVHVLGRTGEAFGDDLEVLAFSSQTRHRCWVWELGRPGEPWIQVAARIGGLTPRGYTRIGPALRHAVVGLARRPAERRLLFLVSDGRPTDYDRYEGRYGIADIRRAVQEATAGGVHVHAFAVDATARSHLPAQFGTGCWSVLPQVDDLPQAIARVYARLTAA